MAKRRAAEPLTFHVPWKRFLPCDLPEEPPPLWVPPSAASNPGRPRKRRIDAGTMAEPSASPSKRRGSGDRSDPGGERRDACGLEPREPPRAQPPGRPEELREPGPPSGGGDDRAGRAGAGRSQHNEEFWQYNTFQYWRNPLPPIDLADIEDVSENSLTEATLQGKNEVVEIDMES